MNILKKDLEYINDKFTEKNKLHGTTILITGCGGFLGYYFLQYFAHFFESLGISKIIGLDNFLISKPLWINKIASNCSNMQIELFDVITDDFRLVKGIENVDYVIHMASIASPTFYRQYPIETMDANVIGLRKLLEFFKGRIRGFLFFSSSEIYGDPEHDCIPTKEDYSGRVACIGPRACYDESKRYGETICYNFAKKYSMPISIVRPFNNYGPGMNIEDKRVPADFAKALYENRDIEIYSNGFPTRTFCYVADAIVGYMKALLYGRFDVFNIGMDKPELTVIDLANIYSDIGKNIFGRKNSIKFAISRDNNYLTDNPSRRCPDISKARQLLNFVPEINVENGIEKYLNFIKQNKGELP